VGQKIHARKNKKQTQKTNKHKTITSQRRTQAQTKTKKIKTNKSSSLSGGFTHPGDEAPLVKK
jgi:hypothetical protein